MPRQIKNKTRPWTMIHIDRFNWLYNYMEANYENINKDFFIDINKRFLIEFIKKIQAGAILLRDFLFYDCEIFIQ
jgi:hypothetical protein